MRRRRRKQAARLASASRAVRHQAPKMTRTHIKIIGSRSKNQETSCLEITLIFAIPFSGKSRTTTTSVSRAASQEENAPQQANMLTANSMRLSRSMSGESWVEHDRKTVGRAATANPIVMSWTTVLSGSRSLHHMLLLAIFTFSEKTSTVNQYTETEHQTNATTASAVNIALLALLTWMSDTTPPR